MTEKGDDLPKEIDKTAIRLLRKVTGEARDGEDSALISEHVKAFSAVVEWYKVRDQHKPPEAPKESKFDGLRREYGGQAADRPGDSAEAPPRRGPGRKPRTYPALATTDDAAPSPAPGQLDS